MHIGHGVAMVPFIIVRTSTTITAAAAITLNMDRMR
jgi:hypothetical protein